MFHTLARPHPWWVGLLLWGVATFAASSFSVSAPTPPAFEFPHFDKVLHFCWFSAGGFVLANAILFRKPPVSSRWWKIAFPVALMSSLGVLDEFRQTFTPGRSGNDFGDWMADTLGGLCGVLIANLAHRFMLRRISPGL
ncbi:MAG: VanZ family protein [Luteolibacter sp.]